MVWKKNFKGHDAKLSSKEVTNNKSKIGFNVPFLNG